MFWTKNPEPPKYYQSLLEKELELAIASLSGYQPNTKEYSTVLANIERLHEMMMKQERTNNRKSSSVSKDALVGAGANLVGIAMILKHEWAHPVTSKALGFVGRLR
jgi:hypothetical protein